VLRTQRTERLAEPDLAPESALDFEVESVP
jgi:hypothetical protein